MAFIVSISNDACAPLSSGLLQVLADHTCQQSPASVVNGRRYSAAMSGKGEIRSYPDGVTLIFVGRPRPRDAKYTGLSTADGIHELYKETGEHLVEGFFGGFGIVVIDENKRMAIAFRDRIGFNPLFYRASAGGFWISNSVKLILACGDGVTIDPQAIYRYLFLKAFESPDTPVKEIRSIEPGCYLRRENGHVHIKQYWDIPITEGEKNASGEARCKEELAELLATVLREEMLASPSVNGLLLSGGVDSSILAALSGGPEIQDSKTIAYNITFSDRWKPLDESLYAEKAAQRASLPLQKIDFSLDNLLRALPTLFWNNNLPTANSGFKLSLIAERGAKHQIGTYMLGEGADTLLDYSWKWKYFNPLYKASFFKGVLPCKAKRFLLQRGEKLLYVLRENLLGKNNPLEILRSFFACLLGYWRWKGAAIRPDELARLFSERYRSKVGTGLISDVFAGYYKKISTKELAEKFIYSSLKSYTPNQQLMNYQTICSYYGADVVCPYLDERVIEYCLKLPVQLRAGKKILKSIAETSMPQEIITREKRVFLMPMEEWMNGALKPLVEIAFSEEVVKRRGLFDVREMVSLKDRFYAGTFPSWSDIWSFVVLEAWFRINLDSSYPRKPESIFDIFPEARGTTTDCFA
jgi:asparagine synthase (glutamine-hydrolysing)